jgi:hypothetical protein
LKSVLILRYALNLFPQITLLSLNSNLCQQSKYMFWSLAVYCRQSSKFWKVVWLSHMWKHFVPNRIQVIYSKYVLGVHKSATNIAILGELGLYPLSLNALKSSVRYWLHIIAILVADLWTPSTYFEYITCILLGTKCFIFRFKISNVSTFNLIFHSYKDNLLIKDGLFIKLKSLF